MVYFMKKEFTILSYSGYYSEIRNKLSEMNLNFVENEGQTIVNFDSEELSGFLSELGYPVHFEENGYIIRASKQLIFLVLFCNFSLFILRT